MTNTTFDFGFISPVPCYQLHWIAIYCIVVMVLSVISNSTILVIFARYKELQTPLNIMVISLTFFNLVGSLIEFPIVIATNFHCRWIFGHIGCIISGFTVYSIGCAGVYIMVAISFERFIIIYKPLIVKKMTIKMMLCVVVFCCILGLFWSLLPIVGWSYYALEGVGTSCSVEWYARTPGVISYNIFMFVFVYFIPLFVIVYVNYKLFSIIRNMPVMLSGAVDDRQAKKKLARERRISIVMLLFISIFIFAWTPYTVVSLLVAFSDLNIPPMLSTLPAIFAKSSMLWSSLFFIMTNKQFRSRISYRLFMRGAPPLMNSSQTEDVTSRTLDATHKNRITPVSHQ